MKQTEILAKLAANQITAEEANRLLTEVNQRTITFKVGDKGGVCVCGLNSFPVTLYANQWERLFDRIDDLKAFIKANRHLLKEKNAA